MGRIANAAVFAVIGLTGVGVATWGSIAGVTCDGDPMRPGDRCLEISEGEALWRTYAEKQKEQGQQLLLLRGGGALFLLVSAGAVAAAVGRSRLERRDALEARAWMTVR